jgi:putative autoinducer-2 (AI-2) aldolase
MDWGMKNRLSRIIKPKTNRTVMLAVDHGYFLGPTSGLEVPSRTLEPLLPYADCIMLTRGVLRTSVPPQNDVPVVLRVSGGTSILSELSNEDITGSIRDCIRLNAAGMASPYSLEDSMRNRRYEPCQLVDVGEDYGIPLSCHRCWKRNGQGRSLPRLACESLLSLGAHVVKTYFCEGFEKVVESTPCRL